MIWINDHSFANISIVAVLQVYWTLSEVEGPYLTVSFNVILPHFHPRRVWEVEVNPSLLLSYFSCEVLAFIFLSKLPNYLNSCEDPQAEPLCIRYCLECLVVILSWLVWAGYWTLSFPIHSHLLVSESFYPMASISQGRHFPSDRHLLRSLSCVITSSSF